MAEGAVAVGTGIGCSLVFPSLGIEVLRRVSDESRGIAIGGFAAFQDLAIGITGPVLGAVAASDRPATVFLFGAGAAAAGALTTLGLSRGSGDPVRLLQK